MIKIFGIFAGIFTVAHAGYKISSDECNTTIYLEGIKVDETIVTLAKTGSDPCTSTDGKMTFKLSDDFSFDVNLIGSSYAMTKAVYGGKDYTPSQSPETSNSYTIVPSGPVGSAYTCKYTTLRNVEGKGDDAVIKTISFDVFSMAVTKDKAPRDFNDIHINHCVGIFDEATILGLLTFLVLISVVLFALCMMSSISPMDRFESPKDRAMVVPTDKNK